VFQNASRWVERWLLCGYLSSDDAVCVTVDQQPGPGHRLLTCLIVFCGECDSERLAAG
jgi:hypothetical protein